jgi:hypothetical protein
MRSTPTFDAQELIAIGVAVLFLVVAAVVWYVTW